MSNYTCDHCNKARDSQTSGYHIIEWPEQGGRKNTLCDNCVEKLEREYQPNISEPFTVDGEITVTQPIE